MKQFLDEVKERLLYMAENRPYVFVETTRAEAEAYLKRKTTFEGYTEAELQTFEKELNVSFPASFRSYLYYFGKHSGDLFIGSDFKASEFQAYKSYALQAMEENTEPFERPDTIVFMMHQGYQFYFLQAGEGDNPPVYVYTEYQPSAFRYTDTFSEFIEKELATHEEVHRLNHESGGYFLQVTEQGIRQTYPARGGQVLTPLEIGDFFID